MKKINLHILFLIVGLSIGIFTFISGNTQILNIKDSYLVFEPSIFAICIFFFYGIFSAIYYFTKKYSTYIFGLINLTFITIPILYFIYSNYESDQNLPPGYYLNHQSELLWKTIYIPNTLKILFIIGIVMLLINIILTLIKSKNHKYSASR